MLTKDFPHPFQFELGSQIRRAVISILLNLAEGSGRGSDKDFNRFLMISIASIDEAIACLDIALDNVLITQDNYQTFFLKAESIKKQLGGLSKKLRS